METSAKNAHNVEQVEGDGSSITHWIHGTGIFYLHLVDFYGDFYLHLVDSYGIFTYIWLIFYGKCIVNMPFFHGFYG